jgi:PAS domain S-box-containing protein
MHIYLLAVNLLALTALLLGFVSFSREGRSGRLFPLIFLVINRSLILIISLTVLGHNPSLAVKIIDTLEVFSTFCVIWALIGPISHLPSRWQELMWLGGAIVIFLSFLPLAPIPFIEDIPPQIYSVIIATAGAPLILVIQGEIRWTHLAPPLILVLANIIALLGLTYASLDLADVSWYISLFAYAVLIGAIHWEGVQIFQESVQFHKERQQAAEVLAQEAASFGRERQRLLESRELISNVPSLNQSMEHIVRSMARITHVDQSVIFMLDVKAIGRAHVVTVYSPERPFHITSRDEMVFTLDNYPPLQKAIEEQQQLLLPQQENTNGLHRLYSLWNEERAGPALIQPLAVQGRPVGALMLANPVTNRSIPERDVHLCRALAPQIAIMVEHRRRYLELELQAEEMAAIMQQQLSQDVQRRASEARQQQVSETVSPQTIGPVQQQVTEIAPVQVAETKPERAGGTEPEQVRKANDYVDIFEAISEGVIVSDATGRVQLVNKAAERILGRTRQELIGQPIGAIYGQIDSKESIENLVVAFSRRNQPLPTFIEDDERAIQGRLIPWRNDESEWMGIIAVFRDATREAKADQARNDLIAALSHELRAPLTTVKGYAELISLGMMGEYSSEQLRTHQLILSGAERMVEVLDNAIQITMASKHRTVARFEEIDATKVINEALRQITPLTQVRELQLIREIKTELPLIAADRKHLLIILDNLLSNACRFTSPEGRVTLRAWTGSAGENNMSQPHVIVSVADSGVGIPKEELGRIFRPFHQLENQGLDEESGMGMGLAVVKDLVELHHGQVWVESTVGVGSMFQVALPVSQEY